ncbi:MAG: hypothetical protein AAF616_06005 [Bacteroidota bacterium]
MKLICTALLAISSLLLHATVITVDNNGNAPTGVQSSITSAISAASVGDTLLIIPSTSSYGNITISKELTIIGVGFNPDMEIALTSTVGNVIIQNVAGGTKLIGMVVTGLLTFGNTTGSLSNVIVENCQLNYMSNNGSLNSLTDIIIRQNVIRSLFLNTPDITLSASNQSNIFIINNVFSRTSTSTSYRGPLVTTGGVTFDHNVFMGGASQTAFRELRDCVVSNNIFLSIDPGSALASSTDLTYRNNLSTTAGSFATMTGTNITLDSNIEDDPTLENLPNATVTYTYDLDPGMVMGSVGENAGSDGTNIGVDGGTSPFKLTGSVLPVVRRFDLPTSIIQGSDANATIEVTGN